jgi:hypothetical protein
VPVVAGRERADAAALAIETFASRLLLCDDAFQHRRLARDVDVVLVDPSERGGLTRLLPAGPLREPFSALARAHVIVVVDRDGEVGQAPQLRPDQLLVRARMAPTALVRVGLGEWEGSVATPAGACPRFGRGASRPLYGRCAIGKRTSCTCWSTRTITRTTPGTGTDPHAAMDVDPSSPPRRDLVKLSALHSPAVSWSRPVGHDRSARRCRSGARLPQGR